MKEEEMVNNHGGKPNYKMPGRDGLRLTFYPGGFVNQRNATIGAAGKPFAVFGLALRAEHFWLLRRRGFGDFAHNFAGA